MLEGLTGHSQSRGPQPVIERSRGEIILLEQLRAKHANQKLYLAGEISCYYQECCWTEAVDVFIAPVKPLFDAAELNSFMDGLLPGTKQISRQAACNRKDGGIYLGRLGYEEALDPTRESTIITIGATESGVARHAGLTTEETKTGGRDSLRRIIWIKVYPDPISAAAIFRYKHGVARETTEPNLPYEYACNWLTGEQAKELKIQYGIIGSQNQQYCPI